MGFDSTSWPAAPRHLLRLHEGLLKNLGCRGFKRSIVWGEIDFRADLAVRAPTQALVYQNVGRGQHPC